MRKIRLIAVAGLVTAGLWGCEAFRNPQPENVSVRMNGTSAQPVRVIYSRQFIAGLNELGGTEVQVFGSDTVMQMLPIDTVIDISLEQRIFVMVEPDPTDTLSVDVLIEIDGNRELSESGLIFPEDPWRWVYLFNARLSRTIEVVL